jgi:hypothetical protein
LKYLFNISLLDTREVFFDNTRMLYANIFIPKFTNTTDVPPNGRRYPRWGGGGEAVQLEKW